MERILPINTMLIQNHLGVCSFNYEFVIDWALELINNGIESENIWMLASFSKPVFSLDIQPYISPVLNDLNLDENKGEEATFGYIHFLLLEISSKINIRTNVIELYDLYLGYDNKFDLSAFYFLSLAWSQLEEINENFYCQDVTLYDIEDTCINEADIWIDEHINGIKRFREKPEELIEEEVIDLESKIPRKQTFLELLKLKFLRKIK